MSALGSSPELPIEVVKGETSYWVFGYIGCFGGPYNTYEQAERRRKYLLEKWSKQNRSKNEIKTTRREKSL